MRVGVLIFCGKLTLNKSDYCDNQTLTSSTGPIHDRAPWAQERPKLALYFGPGAGCPLPRVVDGSFEFLVPENSPNWLAGGIAY